MCTRQKLLTEVWGYHPEVTSRTVDTHVKRLRDKLGEAADLLQTVRGIGFRLVETKASAPDPPVERAKGAVRVAPERTPPRDKRGLR
jgi:DNA-binding winged helix-turn-helix (wHTH) protein